VALQGGLEHVLELVRRCDHPHGHLAETEFAGGVQAGAVQHDAGRGDLK
jgi:hypothetical protein